MTQTVFSPTIIRPKQLDDAPCVTRSQIDTDDAPDVFRRRFTDPVSALNDTVFDGARMLVKAVEMVDRLGLEIIAIDADRSRNKRVQVRYSRACDELEGAETSRQNGVIHWTANRYGVEIVWCKQMEAA